MTGREENRVKTRLEAGVAILAMIVAAGCSGTYQDRKVEPSGFFEDYSQLEKGKKGEALLKYVDEDAQWASYDKILLDPVTVWMEDTTLDGMPEGELQVLID